MASDLKPGSTRVYAAAGVGGLRPGRWNDVRNDHPQLEGWLRAGLVQLTGAKGEGPPDRIVRGCCGSVR